MRIPFLNLKEVNQAYEAEFQLAFQTFLDSGWYILGNKVKTFEDEFASFCNSKFCVGVGNGLDALVISLKALDIGPGDEVIVPSNTYIASWLAVCYVGAKPIPVEPKIDTYNIDPYLIESAITSRTKAIMPVHLFGQICEMDPIIAIAKQYNLYVLEDNAQSQGATYRGQISGSWGHCNATSFYPGKNLGALGDGGAVTTNDEEISYKIRLIRNYGSQKKYYNEIKGINSRLDELQAAFLSIKLKYLNADNERRKAPVNFYNEALKGVGDLILPKIADHATSVFHLYVIRTQRRDELQKHLNQQGIGTLIHYPIPPHLQQAYAYRGYKIGDFPVAEELAETCLSLPMSSAISEENIGLVINQIRSFFT